MKQLNPIIRPEKVDCFRLEVFNPGRPNEEHQVIAVDADSYEEAIITVKTLGWGVAVENDQVLITKLLNEGERELVKWQTGQVYGFNKMLWDLICKADSYNLYCLSRGYPREVEAFKRYSTEEGYWADVQKRAGLIK